MPVEIRELIIRAFVHSDEDREKKTTKEEGNKDCDKQESSENMEQMLKIIRDKNER